MNEWMNILFILQGGFLLILPAMVLRRANKQLAEQKLRAAELLLSIISNDVNRYDARPACVYDKWYDIIRQTIRYALAFSASSDPPRISFSYFHEL